MTSREWSSRSGKHARTWTAPGSRRAEVYWPFGQYTCRQSKPPLIALQPGDPILNSSVMTEAGLRNPMGAWSSAEPAYSLTLLRLSDELRPLSDADEIMFTACRV